MARKLSGYNRFVQSEMKKRSSGTKTTTAMSQAAAKWRKMTPTAKAGWNRKSSTKKKSPTKSTACPAGKVRDQKTHRCRNKRK